MATVRYTREEMKSLQSATDWKRLHSMKDEDIDTNDPDVPELNGLLKGSVIETVSLYRHA